MKSKSFTFERSHGFAAVRVRIGGRPIVAVLCSASFLGDWTLCVQIGPGAGYVIGRPFGREICGRTAWIANAANSQTFGRAPSVRMYQRHFSLGVTTNANRVPWCRH